MRENKFIVRFKIMTNHGGAFDFEKGGGGGGPLKFSWTDHNKFHLYIYSE